MAYLRRDRRDGNRCVRFITCRVLHGLPFLAREVTKAVILGILARAQELFNIKICGFVFLGNHYHMIICGQAQSISPFMNYINGEIAKAFIKLTGNYKGKFWESRFKEQKLATPIDVLRMIVYMMLNPVKAGLVKHPSEYPGVLSFNLPREIETSWIRPSKLRRLSNDYNLDDDLQELKRLKKCADATYTLKIDLFAWKSCFDEKVDESLLTEMLEEELKKITQSKKCFIGAEALKTQRLDLNWITKNKSPTPFIICSDENLRKELIKDYKAFVAECRLAWQKLKAGEDGVKFPPGCYIPSIASQYFEKTFTDTKNNTNEINHLNSPLLLNSVNKPADLSKLDQSLP